MWLLWKQEHTKRRCYINPNSPSCRLHEKSKKFFQTSVSNKEKKNQSGKITFHGFASISRITKKQRFEFIFSELYSLCDDRHGENGKTLLNFSSNICFFLELINAHINLNQTISHSRSYYFNVLGYFRIVTLFIYTGKLGGCGNVYSWNKS